MARTIGPLVVVVVKQSVSGKDHWSSGCCFCEAVSEWMQYQHDWGFEVSRVMRKPAFSKCENKGADQLHNYCAADQHLCFCYIDSTIPLLPKSEISSLYCSSHLLGFVSDLVRNSEYRFSRDAAQVVVSVSKRDPKSVVMKPVTKVVSWS